MMKGHSLIRRFLVFTGLCLIPALTLPARGEDGAARTREIGERAASMLMSSLKKELMQAMKKGGPPAAFAICAERAQQITRDIESEMGGGIQIKRTSLKYRNPRNAPDALEKQALAYFMSFPASGEKLPAEYIQKVNEHGSEWLRYYQPIKVRGLCTRCHGMPESMSDELKKQLLDRYPEDRATGYSPGDFRGVIRVSVPVKE